MQWLFHCRRPSDYDARAESWRPPAGSHPVGSQWNGTKTISRPGSPPAKDLRISARRPIPRCHMKADVSSQCFALPFDSPFDFRPRNTGLRQEATALRRGRYESRQCKSELAVCIAIAVTQGVSEPTAFPGTAESRCFPEATLWAKT